MNYEDAFASYESGNIRVVLRGQWSYAEGAVLGSPYDMYIRFYVDPHNIANIHVKQVTILVTSSERTLYSLDSYSETVTVHEPESSVGFSYSNLDLPYADLLIQILFIDSAISEEEVQRASIHLKRQYREEVTHFYWDALMGI